ncbi:MAG: peptidoglycan-binding protein [[Bacteroides] pectinophilus]|nr:peptidoglycan-binding protein [[Bacteroides] pectinophilus]
MDTINGNNATDSGFLQVSVVAGDTMKPLQDARVSISYSGEPETDIEQLVTDSDGQTDAVELAAPPVEYSMEPGDVQPYAEYSVTVTASGYESFNVSGISLFADTTALQGIRLVPRNVTTLAGNIVIPANTLWGNFPPKIAEAETKPVGQPGEIVLSRVVVPEYIIVHDGVPTDSTARNYYERFTDYIKNVASSEIYSTWPDASLRANILAIISFTLNRVYTEWYRNRGYDFTITSSTAFDHKWVYGRNIFENISQIVDEIFTNYLSRPNVKQPILTQYCDGRRVSCPNWLSQWGSKALGDQGYSEIQILRNYYGDDMYINTAEEISGIPASWPGSNLDIGSSGSKVRQIQEQLNLIGEFYSSIPVLIPDGIYGERTADAVRAFQKIFRLPQTGIVDYPTWYKISDMYVRLSGIAELQ